MKSAELTSTPGSPSSTPGASSGKLSFVEKAGYSAADAAANFVFMTMVLFQLNFYTDTFGLTATAAAAILLWPRLWDAVVDPIVGILADRTNTRWGKFRPWILFTAVPWTVIMVLAYTTPKGWSMGALITYAAITNTLLMSIYSMNNMPYAALGGVMTGDINERARLNSYRFIAVNAAQFIVGGFTLPLVAKFAVGHDRQYGWRMAMTIWAALCLVLFLITFVTTRERIHAVKAEKSSPKQDFLDLLKNAPWKIMFFWTLVHFAILSFRGGALYNYYHHYADKAAMFDFVEKLGLVASAGAEPRGGILETLGYIVHGSRANVASSNVADVFNSIINMLGTGLTIIVIVLSAPLAGLFGKKAVAACGFALAAVGTFAFYLLSPTNTWAMIGITAFVSIVYAPTIPLTWAIFADVADYSEWKVGRRFTGMVFATIGFALKSGLALGSAVFLWLMVGLYGYDSQGTPEFTTGDVNTLASLKGVSELAGKLKSSTDPVSTYLREHLSPETRQVLTNAAGTVGPAELENTLLKELNKIIAGSSLYDAQRFAKVTLQSATQDLLKQQSLTEHERLCLNRLLLEDAYPDEISRQHNQPPIARQGFRATSGIAVGTLFAICTILLMCYPLNKRATIQMADELAERRRKLAPQAT
jgi:glycoside/pentoside/hexuronide:cation symporter, GPH family